jgi:MerR family transcriptional regulator, mercuric resistance operon regulatory protein
VAESGVERFSIGELSKRTGCAIETIRYYERIGVLRRASRTESGRRYFDREDVVQLTVIRRARELDFPLAQIERMLALAKAQPVDREQMRAIVLAHLERMRGRIGELERTAAMLETLVDREDILDAMMAS